MASNANNHKAKKTKAKSNQKSKYHADSNINLHKQLRANSYSSSLGNIRKRLPKKKQRAFSHFIHARGMDTFNDFLVKTVARPNSIIGGSSLALAGIILGVYLAKYYGYSFNYLLLFLLFILGYLIELLFESIIKFFVKYKN